MTYMTPLELSTTLGDLDRSMARTRRRATEAGWPAVRLVVAGAGLCLLLALV